MTDIKITKVEGNKVTIEVDIDDTNEEIKPDKKNVSLGYLREQPIAGFTFQLNVYKVPGAKVPTTGLKAVEQNQG